MTEPEFALQMARLAVAFDKKPGKARLDVFFERLRDIPANVFVRGVDRCLDAGKSFPTIGRLREACDEAKPRPKALPPPPIVDGQTSFYCPTCEDTGFEYFEKENKAGTGMSTYVRRCNCAKTNPKLVAERMQATTFYKPEPKYGRSRRDD